MPTTYAHDSYGRIVLDKLPEQIQNLIRENISLYRIGLHGPDILFYYGLSKNVVNQTGVRLHGEPAYPFFLKGINKVKEDKDWALLAYLLGFGCHFMLDSTCHPYIYEVEDQVGHTIVEKEMDRHLMERDGVDPYRYFPAKGIIPTGKNCRTIAKMFPDIGENKIRKALLGMRRSTCLMIYDNGIRQKFILGILKLIGQYDQLGDHFMRRDPVDCTPHIQVLDDLFMKAVSDGPEVLEEIYKAAFGESDLPQRLKRNYKY